jgi:hypothetical protein
VVSLLLSRRFETLVCLKLGENSIFGIYDGHPNRDNCLKTKREFIVIRSLLNRMGCLYRKSYFLATFTAERLSSPKSIRLCTKQLTDEYEISSNHHRKSSKENLSKSFIIRRRPISIDNKNTLIQSQLFNYDQPSSMEQYEQDTFEDDDDSEDEEEINDLSTTIFNIQPSADYASTTNVC